MALTASFISLFFSPLCLIPHKLTPDPAKPKMHQGIDTGATNAKNIRDMLKIRQLNRKRRKRRNMYKPKACKKVVTGPDNIKHEKQKTHITTNTEMMQALKQGNTANIKAAVKDNPPMIDCEKMNAGALNAQTAP